MKYNTQKMKTLKEDLNNMISIQEEIFLVNQHITLKCKKKDNLIKMCNNIRYSCIIASHRNVGTDLRKFTLEIAAVKNLK